MKEVVIEWTGGMRFEATPPSGHKVVLDADLDVGGSDSGNRPLELLGVALGSCSAMDVISILRKKRQEITGYRIEVSYVYKQGEYPHPVLAAHVKHILKGNNLDPAAVERAVQLSDEKYCSVAATLRAGMKIETSWEIEEGI